MSGTTLPDFSIVHCYFGFTCDATLPGFSAAHRIVSAMMSCLPLYVISVPIASDRPSQDHIWAMVLQYPISSAIHRQLPHPVLVPDIA
eukprot:2248911-Rhodomonas_salina.2